MNVFEAKNLNKKYGKNYALDGLDLNVSEGDIYALVGQNGAGKTTFMKIATGLAKSTSGEFSVFGCDFSTEIPLGLGQKIGVLIEEPGLLMNMSGYDNLRTKCILMKRDKSDYINDLLKLVSLERDKDKKVKRYSLGMKQRLSIAMALVDEPKLLILDEPINGLDPQGILLVRRLIADLNSKEGMTFIISSHILSELSIIATRYGFIKDGKMLREISAEDLEILCKEKGQTLEEHYFEQMGTELH